MASFIFLCLKASKVVETDFDWQMLCLLLALEVPAYLNTWRLWTLRR